MKKPYAIIILLFFNHFAAKAQANGGAASFLSVVEKGGMRFEKPVNMEETPVIGNDELNYQYAIKDNVNTIEIRYLVYPLQELIKNYNSPHPDTLLHHIDPNLIHINLLLSYSLRIQGKEMRADEALPEIHDLSHATADLEFNADWAGEVNLQPCDEFAQKYKYCTILQLHKDNMADAFVMFLYNDSDNFNTLVKPVWHALKFKKQ